MSRFFFDDEETTDFLQEFGVEISFVDPSGSLKGTEACPVYAMFDHEARIERDDQGAQLVVGPTLLTMRTSEAKLLRNDTVITVTMDGDQENEKWRVLANALTEIDDGELSIVPVERP